MYNKHNTSSNELLNSTMRESNLFGLYKFSIRLSENKTQVHGHRYQQSIYNTIYSHILNNITQTIKKNQFIKNLIICKSF